MLCLVTWNVLAEAYVQRRFYPSSPQAVLERGGRTRAIVEYLAASTADLACLQEVEPPLIEAVRRANDWRDVEYAPKRGKPDGVALLARRRAKLRDLATLAFDDGSGHVALLATVSAGGLTCRVATTHLRWDPPGTPYEDRWAAREASQLLAMLGPTERAIACGDLNIEPSDPVYAELLAAGLADVMADAPAPTANPNGRAKRIDHILCGHGLRATPLPVLAIDDATPLPSLAMPSDHIPIGATIER